jgi:hypothetical protein
MEAFGLGPGSRCLVTLEIRVISTGCWIRVLLTAFLHSPKGVGAQREVALILDNVASEGDAIGISVP